MERKEWKLKDDLAVESGIELLEILADPKGPCWVGNEVLAIGWAVLKADDDGRPVDVDAERVARAFFRHDNADIAVLDHHKEMAKQVCETGTYVPRPVMPTTLIDRAKRVKRFKREKKEREKEKKKEEVVK